MNQSDFVAIAWNLLPVWENRELKVRLVLVLLLSDWLKIAIAQNFESFENCSMNEDIHFIPIFKVWMTNFFHTHFLLRYFKSLRIWPPEVQTCNYCVCDVFVLMLLFLSHFYRQKKARTKMCILLIILLVVAGIIALIVILTKNWSLLTLRGSRWLCFKQECVRMYA